MDEDPDAVVPSFPRALSDREADTLAFMLSAEFPGDAALRGQVEQAIVVEQCTCGCATIDLAIPDDAPVAVDAPPVPVVQTHARDMDEHPVGLLLFVRDGRLVYDMNVGGLHAQTVSDRTIPAGHHRLGVTVRNADKRFIRLLIDGEAAGAGETQLGFHNFISCII